MKIFHNITQCTLRRVIHFILYTVWFAVNAMITDRLQQIITILASFSTNYFKSHHQVRSLMHWNWEFWCLRYLNKKQKLWKQITNNSYNFRLYHTLHEHMLTYLSHFLRLQEPQSRFQMQTCIRHHYCHCLEYQEQHHGELLH